MKIRFIVEETLTHECFAEVNPEDFEDEDEFEDFLLEYYYDNGSDNIINDEAVILDHEEV